MRNKIKSRMAYLPPLHPQNPSASPSRIQSRELYGDPEASGDEMSEIAGGFDHENASKKNKDALLNILFDLSRSRSTSVSREDDQINSEQGDDDVDIIFDDSRNNSSDESDSASKQESDNPITHQGGHADKEPFESLAEARPVVQSSEQTDFDENAFSSSGAFPRSRSTSVSREDENSSTTISGGYADKPSENLSPPLDASAAVWPTVGNESATASSSLWPTPVQSGEQTDVFDESAFLDANAADSDQEDVKSMKIVNLFKTGNLFQIKHIPKKKSKNSKNLKYPNYGENAVENFIIHNSVIMAQDKGFIGSLNVLAKLAHAVAKTEDVQVLKKVLVTWIRTKDNLDQILEDAQIPKTVLELINKNKLPPTRLNLPISSTRLTYHIFNLMILAETETENEIIIPEILAHPPEIPPDDDSIDLDLPFFDDTASTFQFIDMAAALPS